MKRLTKDNPQENFEIMMNYVFAKDGWAHIRHDGERENVPLTEWVKAQCIKRGCDEFPGETAEAIDMTVCDCLMDGEGCPVALAYCFACQASHLRDRLKAIEDILGDEYDLDHLRTLAQAEKAGRLAVLPCKVGDTVFVRMDNGAPYLARVQGISVSATGKDTILRFGGYPAISVWGSDKGKTWFSPLEEAST